MKIKKTGSIICICGAGGVAGDGVFIRAEGNCG